MSVASSSRSGMPVTPSKSDSGRHVATTNAMSPRRSTTNREKMVRRAQLIDVIAEKNMQGHIGDETSILLALLGRPIRPTSMLQQQSRSQTPAASRAPPTPKTSKPDRVKLENLVRELQDTERRYLRRITTLKTEYADPLRRFAKNPETMIIPLYDAKVMFANIDSLVNAAEAFQKDIEAVDLTGRVVGRGTGDICLRHMKEATTFDCYRTYYDKQDDSRKVFNAQLRRQPFETFTETVKYSTSGIGNVGIRELLAEPIQRIPRYTLLWQNMVDCMSPADPQRPKLQEAIGLASKIALCETDEQTKKATLMMCLERTIEGLPADLISHKRELIDCIDVEDFVSLSASHSNHSVSSSAAGYGYGSMSPAHASNAAGNALPCTLLLFDDKLVIVKRQHASISGRTVTGCEDLVKLTEGGGGPATVMAMGLKKDKLSFKGVVDLSSVIGVDSGEADFQLYFEDPPAGQNDRWSGRPLRCYSVVHPPAPAHFDPLSLKRDKERFIQNLWHAQALARTKPVLRDPVPVDKLPRALACEEDIETGGEALAVFWNAWQKDIWLRDFRKAKVLVHIDEDGMANPMEFPQSPNPRLIFRLKPMAGGLCKLHVSSGNPAEEGRDSDILRLQEVVPRIAQTIHDLGVFRFKAPSTSYPNTPTSTHKLRPSGLNLDSISRNLFGSVSSSSTRGLSRSSVSRSSTMDTQRHSTVSSRSTALSSMDVDTVDASLSPGSAKRPPSFITAPALPPPPEVHHRRNVSEVRLNEQLDLARKNSATLSSLASPPPRPKSVPPRDKERAWKDDESPPHGPLKVMNRTPSPSPPRDFGSIKHLPLSPVEPLSLGRRKSYTEVQSMPPTRPTTPGVQREISSRPTVPGSSHTVLRVVDGVGRKVSEGRPTQPLKGDEPVVHPRTASGSHKRAHSAEELEPRKRSADDQALNPQTFDEELAQSKVYSPTAKRIEETFRELGKQWPSTSDARLVSGVTVTSQTTIKADADARATGSPATEELGQRISTSLRHVAAIKDELSAVKVGRGHAHRRVVESDFSSALTRSPQSKSLSRRSEYDQGSFSSIRSVRGEAEQSGGEPLRKLGVLLNHLQVELEAAGRAEQGVAEEMLQSTERANKATVQAAATQNRLARSNNKVDLYKKQLADVKTELETVYEAFNVELDGLFQDATLPPDQAFQALQRDLTAAMTERNDLKLQNMQLQRELAVARLKQDEWARLLKTHKLA